MEKMTQGVQVHLEPFINTFENVVLAHQELCEAGELIRISLEQATGVSWVAATGGISVTSVAGLLADAIGKSPKEIGAAANRDKLTVELISNCVIALQRSSRRRTDCLDELRTILQYHS